MGMKVRHCERCGAKVVPDEDFRGPILCRSCDCENGQPAYVSTLAALDDHLEARDGIQTCSYPSCFEKSPPFYQGSSPWFCSKHAPPGWQDRRKDPETRESFERLIEKGEVDLSKAKPHPDGPTYRPIDRRGNPPTAEAARNNALSRIYLERLRQIKLWGPECLSDHDGVLVLMEEVGEVARAYNDNEGSARVLEELVQVGAVALRLVEELLRRMDR